MGEGGREGRWLLGRRGRITATPNVCKGRKKVLLVLWMKVSEEVGRSEEADWL